MEAIRGVRLRKFKLRKIILGVRMHFRHLRSGKFSTFINAIVTMSYLADCRHTDTQGDDITDN